MWRHLYTPQEIAYPYYDCEDCIGIGCGSVYPCQCSVYNAYSPGSGQMPWWVKMLRKLVKPR